MENRGAARGVAAEKRRHAVIQRGFFNLFAISTRV